MGIDPGFPSRVVLPPAEDESFPHYYADRPVLDRLRRPGSGRRAPGMGPSPREQVTELVTLGLQVTSPLVLLGRDDRDLAGDLQAVAVDDERVGLLGIVRQEADPG